MFRRMKLIAAAAVIALLVPAAAQAQTGFGARVGSFSVSGDNVEMDATTAFGAHVSLGFLPILKFQLGVEYLSGTADYTYGAVTVPDQDFTNVGVFADVRYPISLIPMFPLKPVVGGGLNLNMLSYVDEDNAASVGPGAAPADFTRSGYHLMAGLLFNPPVVPLAVSAEYRLQYISVSEGTIPVKGILVGLTFGF
ncbi:MAG: outer membrane beta-barrel protein [bacterium]